MAEDRENHHGAPGAGRAHEPHHRCVLNGRDYPEREMTEVAALKPELVEMLRRRVGEVDPEGFISRAELKRLRSDYVAELLRSERGELTELEQRVVASLADSAVLAADTDGAYDRAATFGDRLADRIASFGGSWLFLILFAVVLAVWMAANVAFGGAAFDPFPFILLNLVLSCLAAVQAPLIMMSQRRQEEKDRLRSRNDYQVNLKAELEIRNLHDKVDHLLLRQWQRLAEIQQIQLDILAEGREARRPREKA